MESFDDYCPSGIKEDCTFITCCVAEACRVLWGNLEPLFWDGIGENGQENGNCKMFRQVPSTADSSVRASRHPNGMIKMLGRQCAGIMRVQIKRGKVEKGS